jgi:hypothetical protein
MIPVASTHVLADAPRAVDFYVLLETMATCSFDEGNSARFNEALQSLEESGDDAVLVRD